MTEFVFAPQTLNQDVDWSDPSIWKGGVVPATTDADVVLPEIYQLGNGTTGSQQYDYFVTVGAAESYAVDTVSIAANYLILLGALSVAGDLLLQDGGEIDLTGGSLSFGALRNHGYDIQGQGTVTSPGAIDNDGLIVGSSLIVSVESLRNTGSLVASSGGLTVHAEGAGGSFLDGTLTGGTYEALSGGTLDLDMGGPIVGDDATIIINSGGVVESVDPGTGTTLSLQQTLQQVDGAASLDLVGGSYDTSNQLTVAGSLALGNDASFSAAQLVVVGSGTVGGNGTISGPIIDDGTITANTLDLPFAFAVLDLKGAVSGTGTLVVGPAPGISTQAYDGSPDAQSGDVKLELDGPVSVDVSFADSSGVLILGDPRDFTGTITTATPQFTNTGHVPSGLVAPSFVDNVIQLTGFSLASVTSESYTGTATGGVLRIVAGGVTDRLSFVGNFDTASFALSAGPQAVSSASPSLDITVAPIPPAPTVGVSLDDGNSATSVIVNTGTPTVTGTVAAGATLALVADGSLAEGAPLPVAANPGDAIGTYSAALTTPLDPGLHQITAVATNQAASVAATGPVSLLVLPDPVNGITTAASVGSAQIAGLLDGGARMQFVAGTEAIVLTDGTLSVGPDTDQALVQRLYEGLLGRAGDTGGLAGFSTQIATAGAASVATAMLDSPEFQHLHGTPASMSDTGFVTLLYQGLLGRAPDAPGLANYVQALANGASFGSIAAGMAQSDEARTHLAADTANVWVPDANGALITELYETAFGRAPDPGGLAVFTQALQGGLTPQQIAQSIAASPEFMADHAGQGPSALVTSLYATGLGRVPDQPGLNHWVTSLQAGTTTGSVLSGIATSPEAYGHLIRPV